MKSKCEFRINKQNMYSIELKSNSQVYAKQRETAKIWFQSFDSYSWIQSSSSMIRIPVDSAMQDSQNLTPFRNSVLDLVAHGECIANFNCVLSVHEMFYNGALSPFDNILT